MTPLFQVPIIMLIGESRGVVFKGFSANTVRPL